MRIKNLAIRFFRKMILGPKASSEDYITWLRGRGMKIGHNCSIYSPNSGCIDTTRPWLIELGDNVVITRGVVILTHGYDWSVIKGTDGNVLGSAGPVKIGDNVFVGMNSIILKNVEIGNNVIIGAGSIVTRSVPSNSVVAGNPARVISTLEEYKDKILNCQLEESFNVYKYWCKNSPEAMDLKRPPVQLFREFHWLFESGPDIKEEWQEIMGLCGSKELSAQLFRHHRAPFPDYESFIRYFERRNASF